MCPGPALRLLGLYVPVQPPLIPESQNLLPAWLQPQGREEEENPPGASVSALPFA